MESIRYMRERAIIGKAWDSAPVDVDAGICEEFAQSVLESIGIDIFVTIGEITNHLDAWRYPEHWSDDWAQHCGETDPEEFVEALLRAEAE